MVWGTMGPSWLLALGPARLPCLPHVALPLPDLRMSAPHWASQGDLGQCGHKVPLVTPGPSRRPASRRRLFSSSEGLTDTSGFTVQHGTLNFLHFPKPVLPPPPPHPMMKVKNQDGTDSSRSCWVRGHPCLDLAGREGTVNPDGLRHS